MERRNDLEKRLFVFAINTIQFLRSLPSTIELNVIRYQLTKSATSAGANYEESQAGSSKADFTNKIRISLREIRESNYWLRILKELNLNRAEDLENLIRESGELKLILGSILQKVRAVQNQSVIGKYG